MLNKRLTTINQYGEILYIGQHKQGIYRNIGDYCDRSLESEAINEIAYKLFCFEEAFEELLEKIGGEKINE